MNRLTSWAMKITELRPDREITSMEVFRLAAPCLYITVLMHGVLETYVRNLHLSDLGVVSIALLATLFFASLARYLWPDAVTYGRGRLLTEFAVATFVVASMALEQTAPTTPLPWLIGLAGIFPLAMERSLALLVTASVALISLALNLTLGIHLVNWLPNILATVFAGLSAIFLSEALASNLRSLQHARLNERRFDEIARGTRHIFLITDARFRVRFVNPALYDIMGFRQEEVSGRNPPLDIHPEDRDAYQSRLRYLRDHPCSSILSRHRVRHRRGHWVWVEARGHNMLDDNLINGLVFSVEDISARKNAERRLEEEHTLLRAVLDLNPSMIYVTDPEGRFTICNLCFQQRFGYSSESDLLGKTIHDVLLPLAPPGEENVFRAMADRLQVQDMHVIRAGIPLEDQELQGLWDAEQRAWHRVNKYPLRDADGQISGMLCIARDITDRKEYEMRLQHQALHDPLTGLPNRRYLVKTISEAIEKTEAESRQLAMLFCDLDFFKSVNDMHGHDFGDKCLMEITRRILAELPAQDFVARFGGNEFVVLSNASLEEAKTKADSLLRAVSRQLVVDEAMVKIQASIGIALLDEDHTNPSELIRSADAAMFQAKERGRNRVEIFDASLQTTATKRAQMDVALRFALERSELTPLYQPKVSILNGAVKGFELLLRWDSRQYGAIPPVEFIPVAENSGLVVPIGLWVLEQACRQLSAWLAESPEVSRITIAVNVSMRQLLQPTFLDDVTTIFERTGVPPRMIELELTETSAMANPVQTIETLARLKRLGLRLALDDFGTGYSSLSYLQKLPIDVLKIDKAFIQGLGSDPGDAEIVRLILALAQTLNLETVAEGVEKRDDMIQLKKMGCYLAQGFAFSPPVTAAAAEDMIRSARHFSVA
ncbi:MAG TPA: EAL domain-containing protein [Noviherbaspirillum sp.]